MVRRKLVTRAVPVLLVACVLGWGGVPRAGGATNPDRGVVTVTTKLAYQGGAAAGTGIVLTSTGIVVTNNHVIRGATKFKVVDVTIGLRVREH